MMRKHLVLAMVLVLVGGIVGATVGYTQSSPPNRQTWEYTMSEWRPMQLAGLKRLGDQGWELIAVTTEATVTGSIDTWYYFKRPK